MKYKEAQEVIRNHFHLIGKINEKGFIINELIMVPQDEDKRNRYIHHISKRRMLIVQLNLILMKNFQFGL